MELEFFSHDHSGSTCVCKDRTAHREAGFLLLRKRMTVYDRLREMWPLLTATPEPKPTEVRVGVDWKEIPKALISRIDALYDSWRSGDRVKVAFDLYDLAAIALVMAEEASHWNVVDEDRSRLLSHLQAAALVRDRMLDEILGNKEETEP